MTTATAIGLYSYAPEVPDGARIRRSYDYVEAKLRGLRLEPTCFGFGGYARLQPWHGKLHRRALESDFAPTKDGIVGFSVYSTPKDSRTPNSDYEFMASYSYASTYSRTMLSFCVADSVISGGESLVETIIKEVAAIQSWDFGYAFSRPIEDDPYLELLGAKPRQTGELTRRQDLWYATYQPSERIKRLRDVYEYNVLNHLQLQFPLSSSKSLEIFIRDDPSSKLEEISPDLFLWKLKPDHVSGTRHMLSGTGLLITD